MPDGPIISAQTVIDEVEAAGYSGSPAGQAVLRSHAGSFVELYDPNLPVAGPEGRVTFGGIVVLPATQTIEYVEKGFVIPTEEHREAVEKRDQAVKDREEVETPGVPLVPDPDAPTPTPHEDEDEDEAKAPARGRATVTAKDKE
jgi:hypothetical protein